MRTKPAHAFHPTRTHLSLQKLTAHLTTAAHTSQPEPPTYTRGLVLFLNWSTDGPKVKPGREAFLTLMREEWGYETEAFDVPISESSESLKKKLTDVASKYGGVNAEETAVVLVMHGYMAIDEKHRLVWTPFKNHVSNRQLDTTCVDIHRYAHLLHSIPGPINYIYDGHFIGHYTGPPKSRDEDKMLCDVHPRTLIDLMNVGGRYTGRPEILASSCWGTNKIGQLIGYLTKLVTDVLREQKGNPITMAHLFTRVYQRSVDLEYEMLPMHLAAEKTMSTTLMKLNSKAGNAMPQMPWIGCNGVNESSSEIVRSVETNGVFNLLQFPSSDNAPIASSSKAESETAFADIATPKAPIASSSKAGSETAFADIPTPKAPESLFEGSDFIIPSDLMDPYLPENTENTLSSPNYDEAVTPGSIHDDSDAETESTVEFVLERPSEEDARRVGASPAKDKGKGKAVLDGSGSDTGLEHQPHLRSTIGILLYTTMASPGSRLGVDHVKTTFDSLFRAWGRELYLSSVAKVEDVRLMPGKTQGFFVVVRVPVEVWTMLGVWSEWRFLEFVETEEGVGVMEQGNMGDEGGEMEMEISEDEDMGDV